MSDHDRKPRRFRFGRWLRLHGVDLITMALAGAAGLGIYYAPPAYNRYFAVEFDENGEVVYPQFGFPLQEDIIPIWLAAFVAFMAPFLTFCIFQIRRRSWDDLLTTTMGVLKSLISAALFQVIIKCLIGGLRPHFLVVCNPLITDNGSGFRRLYFQRDICQGDRKDVNDAMESMPSGHSTAAAAGLIYLALYLNAQLKVMSAHNPAYWKMLLTLAPILGAGLIAGSMTIDSFHHWYDVLAGFLIGTMCAFIAYRMTFASIFDFRFNHILLPRTTSLFLRVPEDATPRSFSYMPGNELDSSQLPFTREGHWGYPNMMLTGAPFDASAFIGQNNPLANGVTHRTRGSDVV